VHVGRYEERSEAMSSAVVVSASYDKQIRLWDAASGRTVKSFTFQESQINSLFLLPDSGYLAVAGFGVLRLYDLATYMHGGATPGGAQAGSSSANQAPPIYSSFESQSSMNFTSLAAVPLLRTPNDDQSSTLSGSSRQLTESASSMLNDLLLGTVVISDLGALVGHGFKEVASLLIATSEDGHIRFFDSNSANTLRILKDIATGAAITCSAVSPDRKYLLTGNQMGQVSMWHLPSIVASVAMEMKSEHSKANANRGKEAPAVAAAATGADAEAEKAQQEVLKAFSRYALQEINFTNDYSAIRSIAIEPMGRWAAVATNAGKVHFIRLARDKSVCGSKAGLASGSASARPQTTGNGAGINNSPSQLTPRDVQQRPPTSAGGTPQLSPQKSANTSVAESTSGGLSSRLALTGKVGSYADGSSGLGGGAATGSNSYHGPRESIYRSALVVNELSANARRASCVSEGGMSEDMGTNAMRTSGTTIHNSIGAVLLDHLEQQQNSLNSRSNQTTPRQALASAGLHTQLTQQSAAVKLAEELEMEVFDTIQAHYKYILRVLISPNAELLMTCSADYSIGRFIVPAALRLNTSQSASINIGEKSAVLKPSAADVAEAASADRKAAEPTQRGSGGSCVGVAGEEEEEGHNETFSPSFASTQMPLKSTPGEQPVDTSAQQQQQQPAADNSCDNGADAAAAGVVKKMKVTAADPTSANSIGKSFDGPTSCTADESGAEPAMEFKPLKPLTGHHRWVWDGVFSDCSNFLFTASSDNTVRMWNGLTSDRPQSVGFVGHTKPVVAVLLCYERRRLGSGSPALS
jgi:WD40 repeat protein